MLFKSSEAGKGEREVMQRAKALNLEARELSLDELNALQPGLNPEIKGAIHYQCDAHTTPGQIMEKMKAYLKQEGVEIHTGAEATDFSTNGRRLTEVKTLENTYPADEVVLAAGSWSPGLSAKLEPGT